MSSGRRDPNTGYRPTSLDFINHPNPVEPHTETQRHHLNGPHAHLDKPFLRATDVPPTISATAALAPTFPVSLPATGPVASVAHGTSANGNDVFNLILRHESDGLLVPPFQAGLGNRHAVDSVDGALVLPRRRKASNDISLDLPKLPVRKTQKRLHIPPTLSGLHQPPPEASILPRILADRPHLTPLKQQEQHVSRSSEAVATQLNAFEPVTPAVDAVQAQPCSHSRSGDVETAPETIRSTKRNKWTDEETQHLLKGVARFGIGNWTKILHCADYVFHRRTALDLKDRFRVVCPDQYHPRTKPSPRKDTAKPPQKATPTAETSSADGVNVTPDAPLTTEQTRSSERVTTERLEELGIDRPFKKSERRSRHAYSEAEDEAILQGFRKYGGSWSKIRDDSDLNLSHRKATDLRDRLRNKFPDEYSQHGKLKIAPRPSDASKRPQSVSVATVTTGLKQPPSTISTGALHQAHNVEPISASGNLPNTSKMLTQTSAPAPPLADIYPMSDVFFGAPFLAEDRDHEELITLDRNILAWANNDLNQTTASVAITSEPPRQGGIDPRETLLERLRPPGYALPTITASSARPDVSMTPSEPLNTPISNHANALPSLAAILPHAEALDAVPMDPEQLELPSLMQWYAGADPRSGAGINHPGMPSLYDILG